MKAVDEFYHRQETGIKETLLAIKTIILAHEEVTQEWKYGMPFFCYKRKMFCYLWIHKKLQQPYIGFVEGKHFDHPLLLQEKRSRMKIMLIDPDKDLPVALINTLVRQAIELYTTGVVSVK
jgi:hypothetical protein